MASVKYFLKHSLRDHELNILFVISAYHHECEIATLGEFYIVFSTRFNLCCVFSVNCDMSLVFAGYCDQSINASINYYVNLEYFFNYRCSYIHSCNVFKLLKIELLQIVLFGYFHK